MREDEGLCVPRWECWLVFDNRRYEQIYSWVQRYGGWMSSHPSGIMFWLPSDRVWYLRVLDEGARAYPERDYMG